MKEKKLKVSCSAFMTDMPPARRPGGFKIRRNSKPLSKTLFTLHENGISIWI